MKLAQFNRYNRQFHLAYLFHPCIGGPSPSISHLIPAGVSENEYWKGVAASIEFVAVRPDCDSLDLDDVSSWQFDQTTLNVFRECDFRPAYNEMSCLVPQFTGAGHIYKLIGIETSRVDRSTQSYSCWSATDTSTPTSKLLGIIRDSLQSGAMRYAMSWRLKYVLKISWKQGNPEHRTYQIFVPSQSWIEENATFSR